MNWNIFVVIISLAFSLIAIVFGLNILKRLGGKLKTSVIFLIFTLGVIVIREILSIFNLLQNIFVGFTLRILMALFILLAILNIGWMIKYIDGEYDKVLKKERQNGNKMR
jgi:hypothetical protein